MSGSLTNNQGIQVVSLMVNGTVVPIIRMTVTGGVFGSVGHATANTTISMLDSLGIDLVAISTSATAPIPVSITVTSPNSTTVTLFGGELVDVEYDMDHDLAIIHARDWAGELVDQKRMLTSLANKAAKLLAPLVPGHNPNAIGVNTVNQSLSQIVTSIAEEFSLTPVLNLTGGVSGSSIVGSFYANATHTFVSVPQSLWSILSTLARDTGYTVYVTPNKKLVFGTPGVGLTKLQLSWNNPKPPQGTHPCKDLAIHHHPRRNATFRVLVFSYDPAKAQQTTGRATVVGANLAGSAGLKPGIWTGNDAVTADAQLANVKKGGVSSSQVPLYTFRVDGLDATGVTNRALGIATDIAKREFVMSCEIDGYAAMAPTTPIQLIGDSINKAFTGAPFYVNGYEHFFTMPTEFGEGGFLTRIKALDIPTLGTGGTGYTGSALI